MIYTAIFKLGVHLRGQELVCLPAPWQKQVYLAWEDVYLVFLSIFTAFPYLATDTLFALWSGNASIVFYRQYLYSEN